MTMQFRTVGALEEKKPTLRTDLYPMFHMDILGHIDGGDALPLRQLIGCCNDYGNDAVSGPALEKLSEMLLEYGVVVRITADFDGGKFAATDSRCSAREAFVDYGRGVKSDTVANMYGLASRYREYIKQAVSMLASSFAVVPTP